MRGVEDRSLLCRLGLLGPALAFCLTLAFPLVVSADVAPVPGCRSCSVQQQDGALAAGGALALIGLGSIFLLRRKR